MKRKSWIRGTLVAATLGTLWMYRFLVLDVLWIVVGDLRCGIRGMLDERTAVGSNSLRAT